HPRRRFVCEEPRFRARPEERHDEPEPQRVEAPRPRPRGEVRPALARPESEVDERLQQGEARLEGEGERLDEGAVHGRQLYRRCSEDCIVPRGGPPTAAYFYGFHATGRIPILSPRIPTRSRASAGPASRFLGGSACIPRLPRVAARSSERARRSCSPSPFPP